MEAAPAPISNSLAYKLHQATVLVDRAADRYLHVHHDISYSLLVVLLSVGVLDHPSQRVIADHLGVSRASITQRMSSLTTRGLVRVTPSQQDARAMEVSLTAQGGALLAAAWQGLESYEDGIDRGVDVVALERELDKLIGNARAHLARDLPSPQGEHA